MNFSIPWRIEWSDELSVGIPEIDLEHQHFIKLVNELNTAIRERASLEILQSLMQAIIADARKHFEHEERLFEEYDYSDRELHARMHVQAISTIEVLIKRLNDKSTETEQIQAGLEMKNLLVGHLLEEDMKYRGMQRNR